MKVYVISGLDDGWTQTFVDDRKEALREWSNVVATERSRNAVFIQVDIGRRPQVWTLGLKIGGFVVTGRGRTTKRKPGGTCEMPPELLR